MNTSGQTQAHNGAWQHLTTAAPVGAPGTFGKTSPANSAADHATTLLLSWSTSPGTIGYQLGVGSLSGDCSVTGGWTNASATSYVLSGLAYDTIYWGQVRAVNASGQTRADGGAWWRFSTDNNPGSPIGALSKAAPANTTVYVAVSAPLSWGAAVHAQRYTVCLGSLLWPRDVMNHVQVISPTTSLVLASAQAERTYWWQVWDYNDGQSCLANAEQ
ncbi:MAG: fibronectin type III domain-containing protein [Methylacidiphilales bacterium]|nr:fibronectin type III domain-containing protein [Candidatus Methylacidiphilales bacterium]